MPNSSGLEALFVRLHFDRQIKRQLAVDLRARYFNVLTTEEAGRDTATDDEQLAFATSEQRSILTFNIRDFVPLHEAAQAGGKTHAGIIVSQQLGSRQYGLLLQRMLKFLDQITATEMVNNLVHLEQFKK